MNNRIFGLLATALLLSSSSVLADGRPTGIRIGEVRSNGVNVEIDVTVTGTNRYYGTLGWNTLSTTVWMGNEMVGPWGTTSVNQFVSPGGDPLPWAIDWGDGNYVGGTLVTGPPAGPFTGTFAHSYATPGTYLITVGDAYGPDDAYTVGPLKGTVPFTGNPITGSVRYLYAFDTTFNFGYGQLTFSYKSPQLLAITAQALVGASAIPALNLFGLVALAMVLLGTGVLLFRGSEGSEI